MSLVILLNICYRRESDMVDLSDVIEIFVFRLQFSAWIGYYHHAVALIFSNSLLSALYFVTYFGLINCLIIRLLLVKNALLPPLSLYNSCMFVVSTHHVAFISWWRRSLPCKIVSLIRTTTNHINKKSESP